MTKVIYNPVFPNDRDEFLTPFDKMFDQIVETSFPDVVKSVELNHSKDNIQRLMCMSGIQK